MVAVPLTGVDGSIEIDGVAVENMREWSWEPDGNTVSVGGFGTKWDSMKPAVISATGSCSGIFATGAAGQAAVQAAFVAQDQVVLNLATNTGGTPLSINAYINKLTVHPQYDDTVEFSFDYTQDGAPISLPSH
jgi:hypothetical protein